jgi:hypothetical protein
MGEAERFGRMEQGGRDRGVDIRPDNAANQI